ncbi:MAG: sigma factor [Candidatus Melainabacteria bacterium]|nr:sigma factor [Candidatus Melainabacteria bacterium]
MNIVSNYLQDISYVSPLSGEEESDLIRDLKQNGFAAMNARSRLIEGNLRLVVKLATQYVGFGFSFVELVAAGNLALRQAAQKFDPESKYKFSTFATWFVSRSYTRLIATRMMDEIQWIEKVIAARKNEFPLTNQQCAADLRMTDSDFSSLVLNALAPLNRQSPEMQLCSTDTYPRVLIAEAKVIWQKWRDDNEQIWWRSSNDAKPETLK